MNLIDLEIFSIEFWFFKAILKSFQILILNGDFFSVRALGHLEYSHCCEQRQLTLAPVVFKMSNKIDLFQTLESLIPESSAPQIKIEPEISIKEEPKEVITVVKSEPPSSVVETTFDETFSKALSNQENEDSFAKSFSKEMINEFVDHEEQQQSLESDKNWEPSSEARKKAGLKRKRKPEIEKRSYIKKNPDSMGLDLQCKICSRVLSNLSNLHRHFYDVHSEEKRFKCKICFKGFKQANNLKVHENVHKEREKKFQCQLCESSFLNKYSLKEHMRIHVSDIFPCNFCTKSFSSKFALLQHEVGHTEDKQFPCDICFIKFKKKAEVTKHMATFHSDLEEKPFKCKICNEGFVAAESMMEHLKTHGIEL